MTLQQRRAYYDEGIMTKGEICLYVIETLTDDMRETIRATFADNPDLWQEIGHWLLAVSQGARVGSSAGITLLTDEQRMAAGRAWRDLFSSSE